MADDATKDVLGTTVAWLGGGGVLAGLGVFLRGYLNGASGQEKELRDGQAERLAVLEKKVEDLERRVQVSNQATDHWRYLCLQARIEAEKLGYDRTTWPPDPAPPTGGTP